MKKIISIIAVIASITLFCACGSTAKSDAKQLFEKPAAAQTTPAETPEVQQSAEEREEEVAEEPAATEEPTAEEKAPSGIRPEFKAAMDSYEAFYDEYFEFMEKYADNPTDMSMLLKYADMLKRVEDMQKKFEAWDESEMSDEELKYYIDVTARIEKKMIDIL